MFIKKSANLLIAICLVLFLAASCHGTFPQKTGTGEGTDLTTDTDTDTDTTPPTIYKDSMPADVLAQYQTCTKDDECAFVNNGCCDCGNGGEEAAINKNELDAFRARFDCTGVPCTEMARIPACGSGIVSCVEGKCRYNLKTSERLSDAEMLIYRKCNNNSDCAYVNNGCCDCANGGKEVAINKTYLESFRARFNCEGIMCTLMMRMKPCGCGTATCNSDKLCAYSMDGC